MYEEKSDSTRKFILIPKINASYLLVLIGTHEMENWRQRCRNGILPAGGEERMSQG
jgi:hypothetical protein